jgi:TatD DNase family protein
MSSNNINLVDSHCHLNMLDLAPYAGKLSGVIDAAAEVGITAMLCISVDLSTLPAVLQTAEQFNNVYASVGVHPNDSKDDPVTVAQLVQLAQHPKVIAIGETGLDYYRSEGDLEWQRDAFRTHIRAAKELQKPLIIHTRAAQVDTIKIMREEGVQAVGGVMHCFTEDWDMAQQAIDLGFYISFSGIVTFKNAVQIQAVAKQIALSSMLVETDSPYLAPIPHRGKPNYPAYTRIVAEYIAELRAESLEVVAQQTTQNFYNLFKGAKP